MTSPCLHSLSVLSTWRDSDGNDDHNSAAAIRTVGLAPNLKHVRMLGCRPASSSRLHSSLCRVKQEWKGFIPPLEAVNKASLESLSFCGYADNLGQSGLNEWNNHTDFTMLRRFSFSITNSDVLSHFMAGDGLSHLEELSLTLRQNRTDENFKAVAEAFFTHLNPLRILNVSGTLHEELVTRICQQHGGTLKKLSLRPYEDHYNMAGPPLRIQESQVRTIAVHCSQLSDLNIRIKRTRGDKTETRCYEALGALRHLKSAGIHLDCSNPSNARDDGPQLETALVNSAIDEALVTSIWDTICAGSDDHTLESLRITSGGGSSFGNTHPGDLMTIVNNLSRNYQITKTVKSDISELVVVELTKEGRERMDEMQRKHEETMMEKWGHKGLNGPSFQAFRQLWPQGDVDKDWREAWRSWPLQRNH